MCSDWKIFYKGVHLRQIKWFQVFTILSEFEITIYLVSKQLNRRV